MVATIGEYCFKGRHKVTALALPKVTSIGTGGLGAGSENMTVMIGVASDLTNKLFTYDEEQVSEPQITMLMRPTDPPVISNDTFKAYSSNTVIPYRVVLRDQLTRTKYINSWKAYTPFSRVNPTVMEHWFVVNE